MKEISKKPDPNSKIAELCNLLDTKNFKAFVNTIKESPRYATLLGTRPFHGESEILIIKAVLWECLECVKVLVDNGANVNQIMFLSESLFVYALMRHQFEIALYLLTHGGADPKKGNYAWHLRDYDEFLTEDKYDVLIDRLKSGDLKAPNSHPRC